MGNNFWHLTTPLNKRAYYLSELTKLHKLLRYAVSHGKTKERISLLKKEIKKNQDLLDAQYDRKKETTTSFSWVKSSPDNDYKSSGGGTAPVQAMVMDGSDHVPRISV